MPKRRKPIPAAAPEPRRPGIRPSAEPPPPAPPECDVPPLPPEGTAECFGPRLLLDARGVHVILRYYDASALCGASRRVPRGGFYDLAPLFHELDSLDREDLLTDLYLALPALRTAGLCAACDAVIRGEDVPGPTMAEFDRTPKRAIRKDQIDGLQELVVEAVDRGARWIHLRGHEVPIIHDPKLEPGTVRVLRAEHDGQAYYLVRACVPPDLEGVS